MGLDPGCLSSLWVFVGLLGICALRVSRDPLFPTWVSLCTYPREVIHLSLFEFIVSGAWQFERRAPLILRLLTVLASLLHGIHSHDLWKCTVMAAGAPAMP